jgi:hypothetical protein
VVDTAVSEAPAATPVVEEAPGTDSAE